MHRVVQRTDRREERGQSVVEFALVLPIMIVLMLAIVDFARIYTTLVNLESAAREAADYGTFGSQKWDPAVYTVTEAGMLKRSCVASLQLTDYAGAADGSTCTNPTFSYQLSGDLGATWHDGYTDTFGCQDADREPPCWVKVTMTYDFNLFVPVHFDILGAEYGLPSVFHLQRESTFAMTDLQLP